MKAEDLTVHAVRKRAAAAAPAKSDQVAVEGPKSAGLTDFIEREQQFYTLSCTFLGGKKFWRRRLTSRSDVHSAIVSGVPYGSLIFLVNLVTGLEEGDVAKVLASARERFAVKAKRLKSRCRPTWPARPGSLLRP